MQFRPLPGFLLPLPSGAALLQFILELCLYGDRDLILQRGVDAFACPGQHQEAVGAAV